MTPEEQALQAQIMNDPRVEEYARAQGAGFLPATVLRELGYNAPDNWTYQSGVGRSAPKITVEDGFWGAMGKYGIPIGAGIIGGIGVGNILSGAGAASGAGTGAGGAGTGAGTAGAGGMGILGKIGSGLKNSFLNDPLGALGSLGTVLSGQAAGSANQRMSEGNLARDFGALNLLGARDQFSAGMQGAQFQREGQDRERKAQMLMSLLNGMQDLRLTPGNPKIAAAMGNVAGGARPSALTGNKEALLALLAQPQTQAPTYQAPKLPALPTAGLAEKIMGGVGIGGSILGALGSLGGGKKPPEDPMKKYADQGYATGY